APLFRPRAEAESFMMARAVSVIAAFALGLGGVGSSVRAADTPLLVVTVVGQAEIRRTDTAGWSPAVLRAEIAPGGAARTALGRLSLRTASGQTVRMDRSSAVDLVPASGQPTRVRLEAGSIWVAVLPASSPADRVEVEARGVVVSVPEGGVGVA